MRRDVILRLDFPTGKGDKILGLMIRLCDFLDKEKRADQVIDYGLDLVVPQLRIRELLTPVVQDDEDPKVLRDTRDKILEQSDRR